MTVELLDSGDYIVMTSTKSFVKSVMVTMLLAVGCASQATETSTEPTPKASAQKLGCGTPCDDDADCGGFRCGGDGFCYTDCSAGHISTICRDELGYTCGGCNGTQCVLVGTPDTCGADCDDDSDCVAFRCGPDGHCFTDCSAGHISTICQDGYTCDACDGTQCVPAR